MAKKSAAPADAVVPVRVLFAGIYAGVPAKVNDVIELSLVDAKSHAADGVVDPNPAAVAYAKSLISGGT